MSRPPIVSDDPTLPYNSHPGLRNLVANMRLIQVVDFLKEVDFATLVEWYWYCQELRAQDEERKAQQQASIAAHARARSET